MSATSSTDTDIPRYILTAGGTTVVYSRIYADGDSIAGICNSNRYDSSSESGSSKDNPNSRTLLLGLPTNFNSRILVSRVELELPREWWLNETKIEDPNHDPYKLTYGRYNLKDPS
ncbi:hypothetical protein V8F33_013986 [Rhypophila sp. PSN 637]